MLLIKPRSLNCRSILVVAPHPDDEIFGLGGLIIQTIQNGGNVHFVYLTDGEGSSVWNDKVEIKKQRISLANQVCKQLKITDEQVYRFHLPDGKVPHQGEAAFTMIVEQLRLLIETIKPDALFATSELDCWPYDHVACAQIAHEAAGKAKHQTTLWYYWVWTWYHLKPWQLPKMQFKKLWKINIAPYSFEKKKLTNIYLQAKTPNGKPWCGVLPEAMLFPFTKTYEIIEESKKYKQIHF